MTNPANDAVECLSFADLYALIGPESEGIDNWSDAAGRSPAELGLDHRASPTPSSTSPPPVPSRAPTTASSRSRSRRSSEARAEAGKITEDQVETTRQDYASQADDNAIISGIEASDAPLGWVGFAFAEEAGDQVKELAISKEPGGECVEPTAETIADGTYPLSRSLYIYVNAARRPSNPAVAAYVDFYLSDEGIASVSEVGYVDLPADQLDATRATWEAKTVGTTAG